MVHQRLYCNHFIVIAKCIKWSFQEMMCLSKILSLIMERKPEIARPKFIYFKNDNVLQHIEDFIKELC